jgi:urease accessory protein
LFQEGVCLQHNDVVYLDANTALVIQIEPCAVIVLSPKTLPEMARACYEIGNKHAPLFLDGDEVLLPYDAPMFAWLAAAGFAPRQETRLLNHALRSNSAQGHGHAGHRHDGDAEHSHGRDYRSRVFRVAP